MPKKNEILLKEIQDLALAYKKNLDINTYLLELNRIIIQNNISDKTIIADEKHRVASWNMGCGGAWVLKSEATVNNGSRGRGKDQASSPGVERSEPERVALCTKIIQSLHDIGMETVLIQEGPSSGYLTSNPTVDASGLGIKNPGELNQVCCFTSLKNNPALAPSYVEANKLLQLAKRLELGDKEYQIIETSQGQIYINIHFEWGSMYAPKLQAADKRKALSNRIAFLKAASACGIVAGDTNIDIKDYNEIQKGVKSGYAQSNGGCSTLDILAGPQVGYSLGTTTPLPPPKVYPRTTSGSRRRGTSTGKYV